MSALPEWSRELVDLYESNATTQFILHGNVNDRILLPTSGESRLGGLAEFLEEILLPGFDIVLSYDLGNGLRVERGGEFFSQWPTFKERGSMPRKPREAIELLTRFLRYCGNLKRLKKANPQVAVIIKAAHLVIPSLQGGLNYDLNAMALLIREWTSEALINEVNHASFLISENLNDLHPLIVTNPGTSSLNVPLPTARDLEEAMRSMLPSHGVALAEYKDALDVPAGQLTGATLSALEGLLKRKQHRKETLHPDDLSDLKKELVEKDCNGLIEFIESERTLDDVYGQEAVKEWIRQDIALWQQGDISAMPMGYLLCGPVGTGKTYMVECLAGEAGVPVVKLKNFRDKWVGSTEGNLEKIFSLLHALGRCVVFIDEADQALGKRDSGSGDSGVSGRVYSMMAKEMSRRENRGRILWILASSRPDLIEVDLKRPGRVDVKIPLFPSTTPEEAFFLIRALCKKQKVDLPKSALEELRELIPELVTPGAAESLAIKVYRLMKTRGLEPVAALRDCLDEYQNPVPAEIIQAQIRMAVDEASDLSFVPEIFRDL
ncbi:MAG: AAA family ATPase [Verrucomicrobiales bacterium]